MKLDRTTPCWIWTAMLLAVPFGGVTEEDPRSSLQKGIEQALAPWDSDRTPGAAVLVTQAGETVLEYAVGMADLEHDVPITVDSVFHVASDMKRFTAASICRLAERGKLRFDDLLSAHIPETAPLGERITLDQLLSHTSGLRDQWSLLAMAGWRPEDLVTHEQVLSLLYRQASTNFPPGEEQMYSNSGYTLLAEVVSRVADVPFADFVHREFFEPNGMKRTQVRSDVRAIIKDRVESYLPNGEGGYLRRPVEYEVLGATALLTSARDLGRWIEGVQAGSALTSFERRAMLAPRRLPNGDPMTYAYGLFEHDLHGHSAIGHGGADGGFRSYFLRIPDAQLGVVVLANTPEIEPNGLAHDIAMWALGIEPEEPGTLPTEEDSPPPDLDLLVGSYRAPAGGFMTVRRWFDRLRLWESPEAFAEFTWNGSTGAFADELGRSLQCDRESCTLLSRSSVWHGERVPIPEIGQLGEFEGSYRSSELEATYKVSRVGEDLVARGERGTYLVLSSSGRDFFDGSEWYGREMRFVRGPSGAIRGFMLSSSRAFDVFFEREATPSSGVESTH